MAGNGNVCIVKRLLGSSSVVKQMLYFKICCLEQQ